MSPRENQKRYQRFPVCSQDGSGRRGKRGRYLTDLRSARLEPPGFSKNLPYLCGCPGPRRRGRPTCRRNRVPDRLQDSQEDSCADPCADPEVSPFLAGTTDLGLLGEPLRHTVEMVPHAVAQRLSGELRTANHFETLVDPI